MSNNKKTTGPAQGPVGPMHVESLLNSNIEQALLKRFINDIVLENKFNTEIFPRIYGKAMVDRVLLNHNMDITEYNVNRLILNMTAMNKRRRQFTTDFNRKFSFSTATEIKNESIENTLNEGLTDK